MNRSEQIDKLAQALSKAQGEMPNPPLDGRNPWGRFATLASVLNTVLPVLSRHGLSVLQSPGATAEGPSITTLLSHCSGQWVESDPLPLPVQKRDAQGVGSAISYARRYSLMALLGVVGDDDDDGAAAVRPAAPAKQKANGAPPPSKAQADFAAFIGARDADLRRQGRCKRGELVAAVVAAGREKGYPDALEAWPVEAHKDGRLAVLAFQDAHPEPAHEPAGVTP